MKEAYEEHFQEAYRFIEEAQHLFHKNENHSFYEAAMAEFSKESYKIRESLDERQQEVEKEKRGIQRKLEDIYDEKRRLSMEEQEKSDEY